MFTRDTVREYVSGALWVMPAAATLVSLGVGLGIAQIQISLDSPWAPLAFQGTADDARSVLAIISSTVVTVIALVLGLTVVALQLASTQFSPRLLRNFLRDRSTQLVLSVFVGTFAYSTAGLYVIGVSRGSRVEEYPRVAVTFAMVLLFLSLASVVFFADHLLHSIQIDAVTGNVQAAVLDVVDDLPGRSEEDLPQPPPWAVPIASSRSGYIQFAEPRGLAPVARTAGVCVALRYRIGEHVVAGTTLGLAWRPSPNDPPPDLRVLGRALNDSVHIGFERTLRQDVAFGMRQLVDVCCKALSPAINDPYTAIQSIDHLSVIFAAMAGRPLGDNIVRDADGTRRVIVPGRRFADYLPGMCGLIRRFGGAEPTVCVALLQLLEKCAVVVGDDAIRRAAIEKQADLILADAERRIALADDLLLVQTATEAVRKAGPKGTLEEGSA
jgi:uncharacterized membrane protein